MNIMKINCLISSTYPKRKSNISPNNTLNTFQSGVSSNVFYYPMNFCSQKRIFSTENKALAERSEDFYISKLNDIPCPACGKKMINYTKFKNIADELSALDNEQYLECLKKYKEYMRPVEESVFNEIYCLSKHKGASKDIRTLLVGLRDKKLSVLQKAQMKQLKKMISVAKSLPNDEKTILLHKIEKLKSSIYKTNAEAPFRRKIMIDRISRINIKNPKKYEKLQMAAHSFPSSFDMNSAWIVKYSGKNKHNEDWSSYDIALRFLSSSIANTDHILAYNIENNHDDISNYMSMHTSCNVQKGDKPFLQWLNEDKDNRIKYLRDYFDTVDSLIKNGKIKSKKYRKYTESAKKTILKVSKGQINLFEYDN